MAPKSRKRRRRSKKASSKKPNVKNAIKKMLFAHTAVSMFNKVGLKKPKQSLNLILNQPSTSGATKTSLATQTNVGGGIGIGVGGGYGGGSSSSSSSSGGAASSSRSSSRRSSFGGDESDFGLALLLASGAGSPNARSPSANWHAHTPNQGSQRTSRSPSVASHHSNLPYSLSTPRVRLIDPPGPDWSPPSRYILKAPARKGRRKRGEDTMSDPGSPVARRTRAALNRPPPPQITRPDFVSPALERLREMDARQRLEDIHGSPSDADLTLRTRLDKWFGFRWGNRDSPTYRPGYNRPGYRPIIIAPAPGMLFASQSQKDTYSYSDVEPESPSIFDAPSPESLSQPSFGLQTPRQMAAAGLHNSNAPQFSASNYGEGFYEPSAIMRNYPTPTMDDLDEERPMYSPFMKQPTTQTVYPLPSSVPNEAFWDMMPRRPQAPQEILPNIITMATNVEDPSNIPFSLESPEGVADSLREDPSELPSSLNLSLPTPATDTRSIDSSQSLKDSQTRRQSAFAAQSESSRRLSQPKKTSTPISTNAAQEKETVVGQPRRSRRQRGKGPKSGDTS